MIGVALAMLVLISVGMAISWIFVASQAARVPFLQRDIARLEQEQARVVQLAEALQRLEGQYDQMRQMLGAGDAEAAVTLSAADTSP
jgi:biopolymer transport protein ExbB/TolQ